MSTAIKDLVGYVIESRDNDGCPSRRAAVGARASRGVETMAKKIDYTNPATLTSDELDAWEQLGKTRDVIVAAALADAKIFADEFPGEAIDGATTEWDGVAWGIVRDGFGETDDDRYNAACEAAGHDIGWAIYSQALEAESARLAALESP